MGRRIIENERARGWPNPPLVVLCMKSSSDGGSGDLFFCRSHFQLRLSDKQPSAATVSPAFDPTRALSSGGGFLDERSKVTSLYSSSHGPATDRPQTGTWGKLSPCCWCFYGTRVICAGDQLNLNQGSQVCDL